MSLEKLDQLAAEVIMGWELRMPSRVYVIRRENNLPMIAIGKMANKGPHQNRWQPTRNIAQAFECWQQFQDATVFKRGNIYTCRVYPDWGTEVKSESLAEAIVRACLKARGIEL